MNIKKIIKEEIDSFDWVREVQPTVINIGDVYYVTEDSVLYDVHGNLKHRAFPKDSGRHVIIEIINIDKDEFEELVQYTIDYNYNPEDYDEEPEEGPMWMSMDEAVGLVKREWWRKQP